MREEGLERRRTLKTTVEYYLSAGVDPSRSRANVASHSSGTRLQLPGWNGYLIRRPTYIYSTSVGRYLAVPHFSGAPSVMLIGRPRSRPSTQQRKLITALPRYELPAEIVSVAMSLVPQLSRLIDLPDEALQQVLDYASTLSKAEAAEHFKNLLGDSPRAVEFISTFNARRAEPTPASANDLDGVPKVQRGQKKKQKAPLHTPAPRQVASLGPASGTAYSKKDHNNDYISGRSGTPAAPKSGGASSFDPPLAKSSTPPPRAALSTAATLFPDLPNVSKTKPRSTPTSRTSTPGPAGKTGNAAKVSISGGTAMHGASTVLRDLDAAIRSLEISTNPTLSGAADDTRRCDCVATRHPLLTAAPNCLNCGKVICVKQGLGPCTSCGQPLLSSDEVQAMIRELRQERGQEKMAADREAHRRPDVAGNPRPFSKPSDGANMTPAEAKAREHRDKLLGFQAQNAKRTTVRDEASDFDVSGAMAGTGSNIWASPEERARELKRQQQILRDMEWNARPDYEKRQQVLSLNLVGGKVVKKMMAVERKPTPEHRVDEERGAPIPAEADSNQTAGGGGAFSKNPLLGEMIKPVYDAKGKGTALEGRRSAKTRWRRVQDDMKDNEAVILDGGVYGLTQSSSATHLGDEPDCG
jgi:hypothetical protein